MGLSSITSQLSKVELHSRRCNIRTSLTSALGELPTGENSVNAVSYLILDCMDDTACTSNVTISKSSEILRRACEFQERVGDSQHFITASSDYGADKCRKRHSKILVAAVLLDVLRLGMGSEAYITYRLYEHS